MKQIKLLKRTVLMAGLLIAGQPNVEAQTIMEPSFKWGKQLTGNGMSIQQVADAIMVKDEAQNIIMADVFTGTIDFDPGPAVEELTAGSMTSVYIWKSDSLGDFKWAKELTYNEPSPLGFPMFTMYTMTADKIKGDIYITGIYGDTTVDFDPGPGVYHMTPYFSEMDGMYNPSVFILKLDANGNFKWAKSLDIYNGGAIHSSLVNSDIEDGLIYFAGFMTPLYDFELGEIIPLDFDPGPGTAMLTPENYEQYSYIFTLNADGEFQWVKPLVYPDPISSSTSNLILHKMEIDEAGSIYGIGGVNGTIDLDAGAGTDLFTGNGSSCIVKLNADAEIQWIKQGEVGVNVIGGVEQFSSGGATSLCYDNNALYLAYTAKGKISVDNTIPFDGISTIDAIYAPGIYTYANAIAKFGTDGSFKWMKQIAGADTTNRVDIPRLAASGNHVFLTSMYKGTVDIDPGTAVNTVSGGQSFIAAFDSLGSFMWGKEMVDNAGDPSLSLFPNNIVAAYPNVYYAGSWIYGTVDIDPTEAEFILTPYDEDKYSTYVAKIAMDMVDTGTTAIQEVSNISASLFPNPNEGTLHVKLSKPVKNGVITIADVSGKVVFTRERLNGDRFEMDLQHLTTGTFMLTLSSNNLNSVYKLVKR